MPFVRISLRADTPQDVQLAIADGVHTALVAALGLPPADRFQVIEPLPAHAVIADPGYLGVRRENVIFVQIMLVRGRPEERKVALHKQIATNLAAAGVRPEDVVVLLNEIERADFSVGNGEAQLLDEALLREHGWVPPS